MQTHFFGFPLSESLASDLIKTLEAAQAATLKRSFALPLYELISRLADEGLDYYFIQSLREAKINALSLKAIELALNTGKKTVLSIGKKIIQGMNEAQVAVIVERMNASFCEQKHKKK